RECDNCPSSVLLSPSFPFVMHGIMVGSFHRLTCAAQCSRSFDQSYPRCEGVALASVTIIPSPDGLITSGRSKLRGGGEHQCRRYPTNSIRSYKSLDICPTV